MRIAHVSDFFMPRLGGIERQVHDLALHQHAAGHDVEIITAVAGSPADSDPGVAVHRPSSHRGKPGTIQYAAWANGGRAVLAGNYDVVHVQVSTISPMALLSARTAARAGIPVVVTVHSLWGKTWPIFSAANRLLGWNGLPIVWTAVSSVATVPIARHLRFGGHGGVHTPIAVLPNGIDPERWQIEVLPRDERRVVITSVMRLATRKRPHQFLAMLRRARALVPASITLEVVIMGDGPRRPGLERYLARHKMNDWVRLTGRATHEQIRHVYRDADFFVAPATLESFGIAALEARSAGLPIIAQQVSGVRDFVTHGREGLLAAGDTDMAERIAQLAMSPKLRASITAYNRANPPSFGWPEVLEQCEQLYRRAGATVFSVADGAPVMSDELVSRRG
jgi:glycosyltransferase involved in cell wall biosynthesis